MSATNTQNANIPAPGTYVIDQAHSAVEFSVRHMMVSKVKGRFSEFSGTITVGTEPSSHQVEATIATVSIDTRDEKRDGHLRGPDFFDADNNKEITFRATSVTPGDKAWTMNGELTIKGVTRPVAVELEYNGANTNPWGQEVIGFSAHTEISRKDFGVEYNQVLDTGGVLVGDTVHINLEIEAAKQA